MGFITIIIKTLQYFGLDPPPVVREKILYPFWKLLSHLSENQLSIIVFGLAIMGIGLLLVDIRRMKRKKKHLLAHQVRLIIIGIVVLSSLYLAIKTWSYDPAKVLQLQTNTINIIVMPILNTDSQSYLHINDTGTYEQDILTSDLTKNMPLLPHGAKVSIKKLPIIYIPSFLYKPHDFHRFFKSMSGFTFIIWGYKVNDKLEQIHLNVNPSCLVNPNDEQTMQLKTFHAKLSDMVSVLFNDLTMLPLHNKLDFLSLLIVSVVEQSLNDSLVEGREYDLAKNQINLSLSHIDSAFQILRVTAPSSKHRDIDEFHNSYRNIFVEFRNNIEMERQEAIKRLQETSKQVINNPYAPYNNPEHYFNWLSKQEDIYSLGRYFPVLRWKTYDSAFEHFVSELLLGYGNVIEDNGIDNLFQKLRNRHGDLFIIDYYEAIVRMATWSDVNRLGSILDRQKRSNKYNQELTNRQIELYTMFMVKGNSNLSTLHNN